MAVTQVWVSPGTGGSIHLQEGGTISQTWIEQVAGNLLVLGGTTGNNGSYGVGPLAFGTANGTISTASTSFVDIAGGSVSVTTRGGTLMCLYSAQVANDAAVANTVSMQFDLDGTAQTIAYVSENVASSRQVGVTMMAALAPAAGAHVVKAQWKVSGNIGYLSQHRQIWVVEMRP